MNSCKKNGNSSCHAGGFAYLWTLMLIAFMGVALTIAADLYTTAVRRDKERELLFIGHEFRHALERYQLAAGSGLGGQASYPKTLEELLKDPRFPNTKRHLRRLQLLQRHAHEFQRRRLPAFHEMPEQVLRAASLEGRNKAPEKPWLLP